MQTRACARALTQSQAARRVNPNVLASWGPRIKPAARSAAAVIRAPLMARKVQVATKAARLLPPIKG